jgi:uncharacterized membrane protein
MVMLSVILVAVLGSGLMAGLFFAFSTSVMRALSERPAAEAIAVMQAINRAILNPVFLGSFMATAVSCLVVIIASVSGWYGDGRALLAAGGVVYLVGSFGVTVVCNVPRNERLERLGAASPESADRWAEYLREWTLWNHVRTVASLVAAGLLAAGLAAIP